MHRKNPLAKQTLQYYWQHLKQFPKLYIPAAVIVPVNILVNNYLPPLVLASIINKLNRHTYDAHHLWSAFGVDAVLYTILSLVGVTLLWRLFDMFWWRLEGRVTRSIYQQVFNHLISQNADFHANQFAGSLVSATNKLSSSYARIADTTLFQIAPLAIGLVFVSTVMVFRAPLYTAVLLLFSMFYIAISFRVSSRVRERGAEVAAAESEQTGALADVVGNVMVVKSFAREAYERNRYAVATDSTYQKLLGMMRSHQRQQIYLGSVTGIMSSIALLAAIISVASFHANLATAFLIFSYTSTIASQLYTFSNNALRNFNRSFGDANNMIEILRTKPQINDPANPELPRIKEGSILFQNVVFTHAGADDTIFDRLNVEVRPGEKIGLVGHSGSGKTTLTRLLLRFSDIDSGSISIDGQDITHITQATLHEKIAYVPQEPLLFHRSIRENIGYGNLEATDAEIRQAATWAHASEFINTLPQGYDTLVGERGVKLSGGQRQRIAIARAMLKNAPILVLDEATSALDSENEVLIQDALWKLMEGRTAIVIAHRLSTIQKMDRIIVLEDGKIVEEGSHKELVGKPNGTYARLWAHQSGGFIEE